METGCAQGYNGTVLAYGQTGSGKTHTMSGGIGHYGIKEQGITPRVIDHVFRHVESIKHRLKPGESVEVAASAVEIYNDEFHDLSRGGKAKGAVNGWDQRIQHKDLKLQVCRDAPTHRRCPQTAGVPWCD
jgi:hypothetical protein